MKILSVLIPLALLPLLSVAQTPPPNQAEYLSLDGKTVSGGNPIEGNPNLRLIVHYKEPVLWIFRSHAANVHGTVLLCPGGGYAVLEMNREGRNTAHALNNDGYDVALLEYHIASGDQERVLALADALKTYRLVRASGRSLGLNNTRVAIMGYSAGGHLATRTAQHLDPNEQPDSLILVYPAYLDETVPGSTSPAVVPPSKPGRLFVAIAQNDKPLWVKGAQAYANAWKLAGGDAEFHLLPSGGHGFGMAEKASESNLNWPALLQAFLATKAPAAP